MKTSKYRLNCLLGSAFLAVCFLAVSLPGCLSLSPSKPTGTAPAAWVSPERAVVIMTYNVENLFDTEDDPGKSDETFLPLSKKGTASHQKMCAKAKAKKWQEQCLTWDWNEDRLRTKMDRLAQVIRSARADGRGPDLLLLQEVENLRVLERLNQEGLKDLGYKAILIEGRDRRGIDVAMLSRLKQIGRAKLHPISFTSIDSEQRADTRGILEARFQLPGGGKLTAFAVHFPAPFHPVALRIDALKSLNALRAKAATEDLVVAAGDFNIPSDEDGRESLLERFVKPQWLVAHLLGCGDCRGTNYFGPKDSWSFLDMIFLDRRLYDGAGGWRVARGSVRVLEAAHPEQFTQKREPKEYNAVDGSGVSDHWPLAVDLLPQ